MFRALVTTLILLLASTGQWTPERAADLEKIAAKEQARFLTAAPSFHWPFDIATRQALMRMRQKKVPLFSYGSLINRESALRTLGKESVKSRRPALAFGIRRVFDYDPDVQVRGTPTGLNERAALNVQFTGHTSDIANGVVIDLKKEDLSALAYREEGYSLIPIVVVDWEAALNNPKPKFYVAYTFEAHIDPILGRDYTNPNILPNEKYLRLVIDGVKQYDPQFVKLWYQTTYLGDGKSLISEWEKTPKE